MRLRIGLLRMLGGVPAPPAPASNSCATCAREQRYSLTLETSEGVAAGLQVLVNTGLFGETVAEAAERIIAHHLDDRTR